MTVAFKEWAIVIDALAGGEQIFILRKGGIHEGRGGFKPEHSQFLLFPTLFHQQRDSVIPRAQERFDQIAPAFAPAGILRLQYWAGVIEWHHIENFETVRHLGNRHIWKEELLAERFEWGKERAIHALALRAFRLPTAIEIPMLPEYGGCKSWVQLSHPVATEGSVPAIDENVFQRKLEAFRAALRC
jgi:hypothetical protein